MQTTHFLGSGTAIRCHFVRKLDKKCSAEDLELDSSVYIFNQSVPDIQLHFLLSPERNKHETCT